ncbi:hypothetical protein BV20DRAFT_990100 [Pilatotrama ljubarskyi]|nr:hypothetical protein BV20DRAFT_990100 [Pilatotrama ljubarskyi]
MTDSGTGLVDVGAHCALATCNVNDFLPIRCRCDRLFCREHVSPDAHDCPRLAPQPGTAAPSPSLQLQRCAQPSCNKPSLEAYTANATDTADRSPALCPECKHAFCAQHREPKSHSCTPTGSLEVVPQKNAAARDLLAKHFGPSSTKTSSGAPRAAATALGSDSKKVAQQRKVAVMKMRHKAKPADPKDTTASVPIDQRLHVKVRRADGDQAPEHVFWFRKTVWTGRALDLLATQLKMPISDTQPLRLLYINDDGEPVVLRTDQALADQIPDGASLSLSR